MPKKKTTRELDQEIEEYLAGPGDLFLSLVGRAASQMKPPGRFGSGQKVFISSIWDAVGRKIAPSLSDFKEWLLEQNQQGKLRLARADLVGAMDPVLVSRSETIAAPGVVYHFVVDAGQDGARRATGASVPQAVKPRRRSAPARTTRATKRTSTPGAPGTPGAPTDADALPIVIEALRGIRGRGRFGDRKVFVSELHERVEPELGMTLSEFKHWLLRQHFARKLVLARADLVAAMDPDLVRESEIDHNNRAATFHFVVDPSVR